MNSSHTNGNRKTIIIGGFGPGISTAVAEQFGSNGFSLALIGRNAERVAAGAKELTAKGFRAEPFVADLSKPEEIRDVVSKVRAALGSISALQWTAFSFGAGDLTTASVDEIQEVLAVAVGGLVTAVQAILPDLAANKGALLVTNGGLGFFDPQFDAIGVKWNAMGVSVANSAKHKVVALLAHKLKAQGIYVGEVVVTRAVSTVKDNNDPALIESRAVAAKFWEMYQIRDSISVTV